MQNVLLENWLCNLTSILGFVPNMGQNWNSVYASSTMYFDT
jgi:hypothetical protein